MKKWEVIGRHKKWVVNATITESINIENNNIRRFVATVEGWRNFKIYEGIIFLGMAEKVQKKVMEIRDRIKNGDEEVFKCQNLI